MKQVDLLRVLVGDSKPVESELDEGIKQAGSQGMLTPGQIRQIFNVLHNEGGELVVTNCAPWAIPGDCQRMDCPMRGLGGLTDPREGTLFLECYPHGLLADVLRYLQASVLMVEMMEGKEDASVE